MNTSKRLRLKWVIKFAKWMGVPVTVHQRYFSAGTKEKIV